KVEVMLVIVSFCMHINREQPSNLLSEEITLDFVKKHTTIIYDSEYGCYGCGRNELAYYKIKNFLNV
ncbi:hypothetical protein MHBO_004869, partial [Bonamia ostreae]